MMSTLKPGTLRITKWKLEYATEDQIFSWEFKSEEEFKTKVEPLLKELQGEFGPLTEELKECEK